MPQQTAVNWLVDQIKNVQNQKRLSADEWMKVIEQAKQMEKEQITNAYKANHDLGHIYDAEQYYNETYNL